MQENSQFGQKPNSNTQNQNQENKHTGQWSFMENCLD